MSTGKLLSNMQRDAPNASMQVSTYGFHAAASVSDDGGSAFSWKSKPLIRIAMPPSFTTTLGHFASARIDADHVGEHLVALAGVGADGQRAADMVQQMRVSGNACANAVSSSICG